MEPLLDKLARQKAVRGFFEAIRNCDKQSDKLANTRAVWIIVATVCSLFVPFAIFPLMLVFTDWDTPSFIGNTSFIVLLVVEWPLVLCSFLWKGHGDPPMFVCVFLYVISGFFWVFLVDRIFVWRKRRAAKRGVAAQGQWGRFHQ